MHAIRLHAVEGTTCNVSSGRCNILAVAPLKIQRYISFLSPLVFYLLKRKKVLKHVFPYTVCSLARNGK